MIRLGLDRSVLVNVVLGVMLAADVAIIVMLSGAAKGVPKVGEGVFPVTDSDTSRCPPTGDTNGRTGEILVAVPTAGGTHPSTCCATLRYTFAMHTVMAVSHVVTSKIANFVVLTLALPYSSVGGPTSGVPPTVIDTAMSLMINRGKTTPVAGRGTSITATCMASLGSHLEGASPVTPTTNVPAFPTNCVIRTKFPGEQHVRNAKTTTVPGPGSRDTWSLLHSR